MEETMSNEKPLLSVVIPTIGRMDLLRAVRSLAETGLANRLDVIVAGRIGDESLSSRISGLSASFARLLMLPVSFKTGDSSRKKNAGFEASLSGVVAFLDDDVVVAADWPERVLDVFKRADAGLMSGPGLVPQDVPLITRLAGAALASKAAGYVSGRYVQGNPEPRSVKWSRLIGCNMAFRADVLRTIGGFDTRFWPGEEMLAAFQATQLGHVLIFHPGARVYHYPRSSFFRFCRQISGYGATRIRLLRAGVELEPSSMVPGLWVLSLLVLSIGSFFATAFAQLLALNLAIYALACLWITADKVFETRRISDALIVFLIPAMHFCYGLAEWIEIIRPDRDLSMGVDS